MKRIVYLIDQPFDARNYERFGVQAWLENGWSVEVWDLTSWAFPRAWKDFVESGRVLKKFPGYFSLESKRDLEERRRVANRVSHFIDLSGDNYCSLRAKHALTSLGARHIVLVGASHNPDPEVGWACRLRNAFLKGPRKALPALRAAVAREIAASTIRPDLVVVTGRESFPRATRGRKMLKAHSLDYDIYLNLKRETGTSVNSYGVFIDQNYCFHSDFICGDRNFFVTPNKYFPSVRNGLETMSSALKVEVRIAAHPRASYREMAAEYFKDYPVEYGRTAPLIRDCRFVVCHDSTAIQLAVLFGKPAIFVTTDELVPAYEGRCIEKAAFELGKTVINLDRGLDGVDWQREIRVDAGRYAEYRNKYIKVDGSPEKPFWDIVIEHVEGDERSLAGFHDESTRSRLHTAANS
ncbi:MAG: hypothetical protein ACOYXU_03050 [Nitrospirota bacterium]